MAYSELIKSLDTLRTYIRSFYIYGFKTKDKFSGKSSRTYDDEKRRLENYLDGYMTFRSDEKGKVHFLSIDSRHTAHNPLYKIFKVKSFTAMDISLHFMVMDILADNSKKSLNQILDEINSVYLAGFSSDGLPEESTLRKKLKEYVNLGLISVEKEGRAVFYHRNPMIDLSGFEDSLAFFSEIAPSGVVGSFLYDKLSVKEQQDSNIFQFKHHYITGSIESDFMAQALGAIREHRCLVIEQKHSEDDKPFPHEIVPLMIYQSTQDGRMYLMGYRQLGDYFLALRFDYIVAMKTGNIYEDFLQKRSEFEALRNYIWGVSLKQNKTCNDTSTSHVTFRIHFEDDEKFIYQRLLREKRSGTVTLLDDHTAQFDVDIFDPMEIIPWVRSFICRITFFDCSEKSVVCRFYDGIQEMNRLYSLKEEAEEVQDGLQ